SAPRRADDRIGDLGIGDKNVFYVARQIDHHGLAQAERNRAGGIFAAGNVIGGGGGNMRVRGTRRARQAASGRKRQRGEACRSDQSGWPHRDPLLPAHFGIVVVVTPKRTVLMPPLRASDLSAAGASPRPSAMLRSDSESVPS